MTRRPEFSIIVPSYGRPAALALCLQSLARLDYPSERFEVLVVDDGGKASLEAVADTFRGCLNLSLLRPPQGGPAAARNTGALNARGTFLAFTDDDCTPAQDWLRTLAARFAKARDHLVGGRVLNLLLDNVYATASQLLVTYLYHYNNGDPETARFFTSNNMALSQDAFRAFGGFDQVFRLAGGEDREFCDRWLRHGCRMTYAPEGIVYHAHRLSFRTFWRQHFTYGCAAHTFHQLRSAERRGTRWQGRPFYLNLMRAPLSRGCSPRAVVLAALLAMSQVANAAGFFWEAAMRCWPGSSRRAWR